jgi:hypothetical protein
MISFQTLYVIFLCFVVGGEVEFHKKTTQVELTRFLLTGLQTDCKKNGIMQEAVFSRGNRVFAVVVSKNEKRRIFVVLRC